MLGFVSKFLVLTVICSASFVYGIAFNKYRIWPYEFVRSTWNKVERQVAMRALKGEEMKFGQAVDHQFFDKFVFTNDSFLPFDVLNNFEVEIQHVENFNATKLAYFVYRDNEITAYNQTDLKILGDLINKEDFVSAESGSRAGGIKSLFEVNGDYIGLVALLNQQSGCAYAVLLNITQSVEISRFPCVPDAQEIDFNGMGGGYVWDAEHARLYLAVGVPTHSSQIIRELAQDPSVPYGKVLSFEQDQLTRPEGKWEVISIGHRNPQSLATINGDIYQVEHGPRGGDEINRIEQGRNFGWPNVSLGSHYDAAYIAKADNQGNIITPPIYSFLPSIGISSITNCPQIYADYYEPYTCALVASMRRGSLFFVLFDRERDSVQSIEELHIGPRIRKLLVADDGMLILGTDHEGVMRMRLKPS